MSVQARSKEVVAMGKKIKHVMVVDDSHFGLKKLSEMLDSVADFKVTVKAKDGYEALMRGDDKVVSGFKNKAQVAMANVTPDSMVADNMKKMQEPATHN